MIKRDLEHYGHIRRLPDYKITEGIAKYVDSFIKGGEYKT